MLLVPDNLYDVYVHDLRVIPVNLNLPKIIPIGHLTMDLRNKSQKVFYIEMDKIEISRLQTNLNDSCNDENDYSFRKCWEERVLQEIGCTLPWKDPMEGFPICNSSQDFINEVNFFYKYYFTNALDMVSVLG